MRAVFDSKYGPVTIQTSDTVNFHGCYDLILSWPKGRVFIGFLYTNDLGHTYRVYGLMGLSFTEDYTYYATERDSFNAVFEYISHNAKDLL